MSHRPLRPLVVVLLLALGDYALWNWSLSANHDILALVSGMTLIPLLIALAWLLFLAVAHLIAHVAQRPRTRAVAVDRGLRSTGGGSAVRSGAARSSRTGAGGRTAASRGAASATGVESSASPAGSGGSPAAPPSSKIAA